MGPRVSVIIPAFNLARYLPAAIDSALAQQPPGGSVEIIVVDDGSVDDTPAVLDAYRDRVKVIRQPNRGFVAAVDRGLSEVTGEYVALLDADDEWPRDRLRRHVAILESNAAIGLVHGDMTITDAAGHTIHPSFFTRQNMQPTDGRVLGRLLGRNFVSGGASTFRADLLPAIRPIAPEAAYPDWWIAACVAAVAEVAHDTAISNHYRLHGDNMGLDAGPAQQVALLRRELPWRRWMMWHLVDDDTVTVNDAQAALRAWTHALIVASSGEPNGARGLLEGDPEAAAAVLAPVESPPPHRLLSKTMLRALSRDPFNGAIAVDLEVALQRESRLPQAPPAPPLIALESRPRLAIAWLEEVVGRPALLSAFAEERDEGDATLAILAPRGADLSQLIAVVGSEGLTHDERCDLTVIEEPATTPARALLCARASSRLTAAVSPEPYRSLRVHGAVERALHAAV
jgi:hypothetical protein